MSTSYLPRLFLSSGRLVDLAIGVQEKTIPTEGQFGRPNAVTSFMAPFTNMAPWKYSPCAHRAT